ncbi:ankyrin repeat domain-containing protein [Sphingomonas sp. FW199]|uniref:ankyrin repeat domain-containing protein n=1 Tax=Sphingomonas sp. FW199 TaxID=3400217 RepID=UPI003CE8DB1A
MRWIHFAAPVMVAIAAAAPVAAQQTSKSHQFLEAVREGELGKVREILGEPGQRVIDTRDRSTGEAGLHIAVKKRNLLFVRLLLANGGNPNVPDGQGNTAAMLAVEQNFPEAIDVLVRYKANFNQSNARGETPLIRAVQLRNVDMVRTLLAAGADPDKTDNMSGSSARDYAKGDSRNPVLLRLIETATKPKAAVVSGPTG